MNTRAEFDFARLIPELTAWNGGGGISVEDWVACSGSFELAIGYSRLFWPDFVEHEGCVFFASFSPESYREWTAALDGDRRGIERAMNHRHVASYFSHAGRDAADEQLVYLGRVLRDAWQTKLARDFPGRAFVVSFAEGPFEDQADYEVTFWQQEAASTAAPLA
jgi:hypothetical protein